MVENKMVTGRQIGSFHQERGLPCQDYVCKKRSEHAACVVLSDGAGSVEHSEIASETAAEYFADFLVHHFDDALKADLQELKTTLLDGCQERLRQRSEMLRCDATLLAAAVSDRGEVILIHIGDGYIFSSSHGEVKAASLPENGKSAEETYFLSGENAVSHLRIRICKNEEMSDGFLLCSDGAGASLYDKMTGSCARAVSTLFRWCREYPEEDVEKRLTEELDYAFRMHSQDDMSIGILTFEPPEMEVSSDIPEADTDEIFSLPAQEADAEAVKSGQHQEESASDKTEKQGESHPSIFTGLLHYFRH
ncbi:MAG: PP2C family serine/threonine-protein phosphatase [Eubacterium sp.]